MKELVLDNVHAPPTPSDELSITTVDEPTPVKHQQDRTGVAVEQGEGVLYYQCIAMLQYLHSQYIYIYVAMRFRKWNNIPHYLDQNLYLWLK